MNNIRNTTPHSPNTHTTIMASGLPFAYYLLEDHEEGASNCMKSHLTEALKLASTIELERLKLKKEKQVMAQQLADSAKKLAFYDEVAETGNLYDIDEAAKIVKSGRTRVFNYLRKHRVLKGGVRKNMPYQKYLDAGLFEVKHLQYRNRNTGELQLKSMPFLTGKGLIWLQQFIAKNGRTGL